MAGLASLIFLIIRFKLAIVLYVLFHMVLMVL